MPQILLPTRRPEAARELSVLPTARVVKADVHDAARLRELLAGADAVISLVGILHSREAHPYGADFARAHVELPQKIVAAAKACGVARIVHVSALAAAADAPSGYLKSKAAGEAVLRGSGLGVSILQPSVVFGRGDSFLTLFAGLSRIAPVLPLAGAGSRFAPVWVEDVATSVLDCLAHPESIGQTYPLCGPRDYSLSELVTYAAACVGRRPLILPLPYPLAWLQARVMEFLPNPPMTRDNLRSLQQPSVCAAGCRLPFGRVATPLEQIAPGYLA